MRNCSVLFVDCIRPRLRQELHGFTYLIEVLDLTLRSAEEAQRQLNDQEVDLCCEVLKILFNVTVGMESTSLDEVSRHHLVLFCLYFWLWCHTLVCSDSLSPHRCKFINISHYCIRIISHPRCGQVFRDERNTTQHQAMHGLLLNTAICKICKFI